MTCGGTLLDRGKQRAGMFWGLGACLLCSQRRMRELEGFPAKHVSGCSLLNCYAVWPEPADCLVKHCGPEGWGGWVQALRRLGVSLTSDWRGSGPLSWNSERTPQHLLTHGLNIPGLHGARNR